MAKIPTYNTPQVAPNALPQAFASDTQGRNYTPEQGQQLGQALGQVGQQMSKAALDMAQQANELRVNDALNQLKEESLRLTYDKDTGYTNLRGVNALERPDGKPLEEEYGSALQTARDTIMAKLSNDAQRLAFQRNADGLMTSFRGNLIKHESDEFRTYAQSISEGVQATALREIGLSWNNTEAVDKAVTRIRAETYRQGQLLGKSAEWQEAQARKMASTAHKTALGAALENGDLLYADGYLAKYKDQMEADDILQVRGLITKEMDVRVGTELGAETFASFAPRIATSDFDRLSNIALGAEATSDTEQSRAGREELAKLLQRYDGDVGKTLAAQRWGADNVDKAFKEHGANWLAHAPAATREYVEQAAGEFGTGAGAGSKPTLAEMRAALRRNPQLAGNPKRLKYAEDRLEADYKAYTDGIKQREDEALDAAYRGLYANGGNIAGLPAAVRAAIPGQQLDSVLNFARSVAKGTHANNPEAWAQILSLPRAELARMDPIDFYRSFRPVLDDAHLEKGYALLAEAQGSVGSDAKHLEIITTANRVKQAAINAQILPAEGKPDEAQIKAFSDFQLLVDERVRQFERVDLQGKRKANSEELQKVIDGAMLDKAFVPRAFWWDSERPIPLLSAEDQARAYVVVNGEDVPVASIPTGQRAVIASKLRARGLPVTEQAVAELWVRAGKPK